MVNPFVAAMSPRANDGACYFMSGYERVGGKPKFVVDESEVGMTDTAIVNFDLHFFWCERRQLISEGL